MDAGSGAPIARSGRSSCRGSLGQKLGTFVSRENHGDLMVLKDLIEAGKVTPVVDRAYPLSEVADAIRYMREGRARGKVVITM
jgi:NADPH:quinone reductase-like Zn-dependent oxidoreductase